MGFAMKMAGSGLTLKKYSMFNVQFSMFNGESVEN